jgi:hypothetical protein
MFTFISLIALLVLAFSLAAVLEFLAIAAMTVFFEMRHRRRLRRRRRVFITERPGWTERLR